MEITTETLGGFTILHLQGDFDALDGSLFLREIDELCRAGVNRVALNLSKVRFMGSSALGSILSACKRVSADHGRLVVSRPSMLCREIMGKVGIERAVSIYASDEEAGRALVA